MGLKKIFYSDKAPKPKGPYSQAVIYDGLLYISGQVPVDPQTGLIVKGTIEQEVHAVLNSIRIIAEEAGTSMENVLKVTCYLADMNDFQRFNSVYREYFHQDPPSRAVIQAGKLPLDVSVEIEAIVALPLKSRHE